jgi:hypothetical protein
MFVGKKILDYSSTVRGEHAMFGVVEPNEEMTASAEGVGVKVILEDADGNELANLIIGKKVKNEPGRRFVRRTSTTSDIVLIAEIDPTKLSTKFENWIATDLLQLNAFDIDGVTLKDYSLSRSAGGYRPIQRLQVDAAFDSTTGIWSLNEMLTYTAEGAVPTELLDDEELNAEALDSLRKALDDLKIVNVARKPDGLSADLTLGENFLNKQESIDDLIGKGFHADTIAKKLYSANGEAHISMKGGVRYVLRFGGTSSTRDEAGQLHRFLFVTAEVDYSKLPSPQLIELPTAKPGEDKDELAARRSQIAKENERKVAEWEGKKRAAEDRVRALQARFGPWYYVISEDVYRDIHLGRNDLIAESRGENNLGYGVDDFRALQQGGLY